VQIIELALLRVAQDVVSFRNPLETLLCMTISWIDVRVISPGQPPKSTLDVSDGRRPADLKNDVEIVFTGHDLSDQACSGMGGYTPDSQLLFLLIVRVNVLSVDHIVGLLAAFGPCVLRRSGIAAGMGPGLVHRFSNFV